MVKRLFFYITFLTFFIVVFFVFILFFIEHKYSNEVLNDMSVGKYEDEYKVNFDYLHLINDMIKSKKEQLFDNYANIKKEQTLSYISSINTLIPAIKDRKLLSDYLATMPITIKIVNRKYIIIASSNVQNIGKHIKLPCNPLNNRHKVCSKIVNEKIYGAIYNHKTNNFIVGETEINPSKSKEIKLSLNNFIKIIPNIIIYRDRSDVIKFNDNNFYMMEYEKFLDLFYGIKINSNKIKRFANNIINKIKKYEISLFYNIIILLCILVFITFLLYWFFYSKIKIADRLYNEFSTNAKYDKLTQTLNRYAFEDEFKTGSYLRLSIVDLDNFKYINDNFGHNIGDKVLKEFASLIKKYFENCTVGRWGGDEFLILTSYTKDEMRDALMQINKKLFEFQKSFDKKMEKIVSASIGSVVIESRKEFEELFKKADLALYKVKKSHKGNIVFYEEIDYVRIEKDDL